MNETEVISGTSADWLADKALRGLIGAVMRLPYERRVPLMGRTLRDALGPLMGYRRRAEANLALIYPSLTPAARRHIAKGVCDNFGRTLIENYSHDELAARLVDTPVEGEGVAALADAHAAGRPVVFVTGHFGNHEVPRHVLTAKGYEIGGLYRKMANPYFNEHYAPTMTSWGGPVFEQGRRGTMGFARHLAGGGKGTLLFDVNRDDGTPIPFLGKPALTATSAADLALKFDALVLPYFGTRAEDGLNFKVVLEAPIAHASPVAMMQAMTARLEARIAACPEQWFWVHRRWKADGKKS